MTCGNCFRASTDDLQKNGRNDSLTTSRATRSAVTRLRRFAMRVTSSSTTDVSCADTDLDLWPILRRIGAQLRQGPASRCRRLLAPSCASVAMAKTRTTNPLSRSTRANAVFVPPTSMPIAGVRITARRKDLFDGAQGDRRMRCLPRDWHEPCVPHARHAWLMPVLREVRRKVPQPSRRARRPNTRDTGTEPPRGRRSRPRIRVPAIDGRPARRPRSAVGPC